MKRIMFVTIVPPFPDDQGNRVYTLSIMNYLVKKGYFLDVILQGGCDKKAFLDHFGNKANLIQIEHNSANINKLYSIRDDIRKLLRDDVYCGYNAEIKREIFIATNHFDPFEAINDKVVEKAKRLLKECYYEYIICNYIYSLRVVYELREMIENSKSMVFTIDAVSNLDSQSLDYGIDTTYRACSARMEAECLNVADKVLAISKSELRYFEGIGVKNVFLCEYNAFDILRSYQIKGNTFHKKRIIFAASGNPLNKIGLDNFLKRVWPGLLHMDNEIRLLICGSICDHFNSQYKNVLFKGKLSSPELYSMMSGCTISINPTFLGTGLKIKSVESISIGLPFVSFDEGVDGLQELNNNAFLIAEDWIDFGYKAFMLLNNKQLWLRLHRKALQIAQERFSMEEVFKSVL